MLADAFAHHVWATLRLMDSCDPLSDEQLSGSVPGTYGSILDTMRHLVGADCSYLAVTSGDPSLRVDDEEGLDLRALRGLMERNGRAWSGLLARNPDPDIVLVRHRDDGSQLHAPMSIRLAQALHHGTDHRSQICTALTVLGIEPPYIDVWDFGEQAGSVTEVAAGT